MSQFWPKSKAIALVFCPKLADQNWNWLTLIAEWPSDDNEPILAKLFSKAIALVFCPKMTKIEIDWLWLQNEKWWFQWANFGQKVRL